MKTGKHYFGLLTEEEQRNFKEVCSDRRIVFDFIMNKTYIDLNHFINNIRPFTGTKQGHSYWFEIIEENRTEQPKQPLATFRLTLIYLAIVYGCLGLLWLVYHIGHQQGYKIGYRNGIEKVDSIVNYEELTTESVEAVQELQLNTTRYEN